MCPRLDLLTCLCPRTVDFNRSISVEGKTCSFKLNYTVVSVACHLSCRLYCTDNSVMNGKTIGIERKTILFDKSFNILLNT